MIEEKKRALYSNRDNRELQDLVQTLELAEKRFLNILLKRVSASKIDEDINRKDQLKSKYRTRHQILKNDREYHQLRIIYAEAYDRIEEWLSRHDRDYREARNSFAELEKK